MKKIFSVLCLRLMMAKNGTTGDEFQSIYSYVAVIGWFRKCCRVGPGRTSGHGICGLSHLSLRSFAAVMAFMVSTVIAVAIV